MFIFGTKYSANFIPLFLITILVCAVIFPTSQGRKLRPRKIKLFA